MEMAIAILHNDIVCVIDNGNISVLIFLDLSFVFDMVNHAILFDVTEEHFCVKNIEHEKFR